MPNASAAKIVRDALALRITHPHAPAIDLLDLVMRGHEDSDPDFTDDALPWGDHFDPRAPFGQLVAGAFDKAMSPADWLALTSEAADARVAETLMGLWADDVTPAFARRYRVWSEGKHATG
jgi:hypothetical protein